MSEKKKNEAKCEKQKEVQALDDAALESASGGMIDPRLFSFDLNKEKSVIFKPDYLKKIQANKREL